MNLEEMKPGKNRLFDLPVFSAIFKIGVDILDFSSQIIFTSSRSAKRSKRNAKK